MKIEEVGTENLQIHRMNFKKLAPSSSGFGQLFRTLLCAHAQNAHITNRLLSISYKAVPKLCKLLKKHGEMKKIILLALR